MTSPIRNWPTASCRRPRRNTRFSGQRPDRQPRGNFGDSPEWGSAFILVPWQQYEFDGDLNLFRLHYDAMTNYLAYLGSRATNYIVNYGLGDWYDIGPKHPGVAQLTPIALTATAFYYQDAEIMARAAALLGKNGRRETIFRAWRKKSAPRSTKNFTTPTNQFYATGSQCANSIPLVMGFVEPANRAAVLDAIVARRARARQRADRGRCRLPLSAPRAGRWRAQRCDF